MPHRFDPVLATAWEAAVDQLASGMDILGGVYPMTIIDGVVLLAVADDETRGALETVAWKPRLLALLRECLGPGHAVTDLAGIVHHQQPERSSGTALW